jgi:glycosyltransferase involved in cell wall biosynthesis
MSLRIAMIGQKGIPATYGGVERSVEELAAELVRRGNSVTVYTRPYYTPATKTRHRGISLISLPTLKTKHLDAITHSVLASFHAARKNYDIIHYHGVGPSLAAFIPRLLGSRAKIVVTMQCLDRHHEKWGGMARAILRISEWTACKFPHRTIVVTRLLQRYCRAVYGTETTYIPNGVAPSPRSSSEREATLLHRFGLVPLGYVLSVSRLIQHKNIHLLIQAFRRLKTTQKLVIVGGGFHTDEYVKRLHELAAGDPRIIFTGFQSGRMLTTLFANARLFVTPSRAEGMPLALLEAAGHGLGILANDIPEHREVLSASQPPIGHVFRRDSLADLERMLASLLRHPRELERLGQHAHNTVAEVFPWTKIAEQTEALYLSGLPPHMSPRLVLSANRG